VSALRVLLYEYNLDDPSKDIDDEIINEEEQYLNQILGNLTQHPKVFDYRIDRISDTTDLNQYDSSENMLLIQHEYRTTPRNGNDIDGQRYSTPFVKLPSGGVKKGGFIEEVTEASAGMRDAPGYGGSSPYTVKVPGSEETAELNSFGETVYNLNLLLNKRTEIE
jgi:hypothetical protein